MPEPFQILSLSGGGVRAAFQARLLERAAEDAATPIASSFDLIAATSTGALVGLALALDIDPARIVSLYRLEAERIFRPRTASWLRRGGRYNPSLLGRVVKEVFGLARMSDVRTRVLIATSVVDTYQGRFFTESDTDTLVADVAMASAAAPTYFPPVIPEDQNRGYMDGGLWANDPSYFALHYALNTLGVTQPCVFLLAIGTGRVEHGEAPGTIRKMRTFDARTPRFVFDFLTSLQAWSAEHLAESSITSERVTRINPYLRQWISLDDAKRANELLPGLAESEYERFRPQIEKFLMRSHVTVSEDVDPQLPLVLRRGLYEANITKFVPSRKYYAQFREGRESISSYVALATTSLTMVSINLATGLELEKVVDVFEEMIVRRGRPVRIVVSLLDPERYYLMEALAPVLDLDPAELRERVVRALARLLEFERSLSRHLRPYFRLHAHASLPNASAIMIDEDLPEGVIQLETKAYQASFINSFGFEVGFGSEFYATLRTSYQKLIADARSVSREKE